MAFLFADWLKEQRGIRNLSQAQLSELTDGEISQNTISSWENNKTIPSIRNIAVIAHSLQMSLSNIPWDYIDFGVSFEKEEPQCLRERFSLYDLPQADSLKTFDGKVYELKGFVGIERDSGQVEHVTNLYYRTRTVVSNSMILAKRKNVEDELMVVKRKKKVKSQ